MTTETKLPKGQKYAPDRWVLCDVDSKTDNPWKIVLCGWYGGYLGADEWRISSKIENTEIHNEDFKFTTHSGNEYVCRKKSEGMTTLMASVLEGYKAQNDIEVHSMEDGAQNSAAAPPKKSIEEDGAEKA